MSSEQSVLSDLSHVRAQTALLVLALCSVTVAPQQCLAKVGARNLLRLDHGLTFGGLHTIVDSESIRNRPLFDIAKFFVLNTLVIIFTHTIRSLIVRSLCHVDRATRQISIDIEVVPAFGAHLEQVRSFSVFPDDLRDGACPGLFVLFASLKDTVFLDLVLEVKLGDISVTTLASVGASQIILFLVITLLVSASGRHSKLANCNHCQ